MSNPSAHHARQPITWGDSNCPDNRPLIDQCIIRCWYGRGGDARESFRWFMHTHYTIDSGAWMVAQEQYEPAPSIITHSALVLVRVVEVDGTPVCVITILHVEDYSFAGADQFSIASAPDGPSLYAMIQRWATEQYGDDEGLFSDLSVQVGM